MFRWTHSEWVLPLAWNTVLLSLRSMFCSVCLTVLCRSWGSWLVADGLSNELLRIDLGLSRTWQRSLRKHRLVTDACPLLSHLRCVYRVHLHTSASLFWELNVHLACNEQRLSTALRVAFSQRYQFNGLAWK